MPRPVHFEIRAGDPQALRDFYSEVFGWTFQKWGDIDYWVITTGEEAMGINGGLLPRTGPLPEQGSPINAATLVIGVDSCQAYYDRSMAAGAVEQLPVTRTPGVGTMAYFTDPEGNHYGIIEPEMPPQG